MALKLMHVVLLSGKAGLEIVHLLALPCLLAATSMTCTGSPDHFQLSRAALVKIKLSVRSMNALRVHTNSHGSSSGFCIWNQACVKADLRKLCLRSRNRVPSSQSEQRAECSPPNLLLVLLMDFRNLAGLVGLVRLAQWAAAGGQQARIALAWWFRRPNIA